MRLERSPVYRLWTLYWHGTALAGMTSPVGLFIGTFMITVIERRLHVCYNGRWF